MGLRAESEAALAETLEDTDLWGWPITITDPSGLSASLTGQSGDIAQVIDPQTGDTISGRLAHCVLRISSLTAAGFTSLPRAIAERASKPWVVVFDDINGTAYTFKVRESNPDRTIGLVTLLLEAYQS
jgi:hypothetical protein